jgi:hypothetical protein
MSRRAHERALHVCKNVMPHSTLVLELAAVAEAAPAAYARVFCSGSGGKLSFQRTPTRWVTSEHVSAAACFVRGCSRPLNVAYGSKAAVDGPQCYVRFSPQSGTKRTIGARLLSATSGRW